MTQRPLAVGLLVWILVLGGATGEASAQAAITGSIKGIVTDDTGDFLPGTLVEVRGQTLGASARTAISNEEGMFIVNNLPVGIYTMTVTMLGYQPVEMIRIIVDPDVMHTFQIELREGLTEKVVVNAERPLVDTSNTSTREVVDSSYVNKLPLISRRYQQILTLFPGVSNDAGFTLAQYHINGSRTTQNGFRLDGANINDVVTGTFGLNINQNSIERFELNTSGYQAEYGEHSGGIANIITKSGTNEFETHYSGFYRGDAFGADLNNFTDLVNAADGDQNPGNNNNPRPETQQWQELSFSGPLVENRAWFHSSFQYWQEDIGSIFSDSVRRGDRYHGQFKATWQVNPDNLFVVNLATDPSFFENLITDARYQSGTNYDQTQGGYFLQFRDTHTLSPEAFLETQLYVHHQYLTVRPSEDNLGLFTLTFNPGMPFAATGTYPVDQDRSTDRIRLSSAVTMQKGTHRIKGGLDYSFLDFTGTSRVDDIFVDLSAVVGYTLTYTYDYHSPELTDRSDAEYAAYIQDSWVIDEHWTVEAGARLDRQTIIGETNVAPRLGVAFDPQGRGRTRVYANYGRFYDSVFTDFIEFQNTDGLTKTVDYGSGTYAYEYDYAVDGDIETPYKDSWTLGFEQELPGKIRVGVSTTHWEGENQLRTTFTTDLATVPPDVSLDPNATAAVIFDTKGRAEYDDYKIMLRKPFSNRFEVIGSYTRSRVRGDVSEDFGFENRADMRALDFTRLTYDRPDVINLSAFGLLPMGFEVTGIYRYQSGRLYSPLNAFGDIDTSIGGKNSERMPPLRSLDLSVSKRLDLGRAQAKLTAQIFNITNELNVIDVERFTTAGPFFGEPVEVDFGRIYQFGVEVRF